MPDCSIRSQLHPSCSLFRSGGVRPSQAEATSQHFKDCTCQGEANRGREEPSTGRSGTQEKRTEVKEREQRPPCCCCLAAPRPSAGHRLPGSLHVLDEKQYV